MTTDSTRFIIVAHPRTGSNLLASSLRQHPLVVSHGELFHDAEQKRASWANGGRYLLAGEDPVRFVEDAVFGESRSDGARVIGFRIFYDQSRKTERARRIWDHLLANRDIRVIHLVRHNLLEAFVSRSVALRTGEWLRRPGREAATAPEPFDLDPRDCGWFFNYHTERREWARATFAAHPFLEISYDELSADLQASLGRVFAFLGVDPIAVEPPYRKQAGVPVREQIGNFAELRDTFRGTAYEWFFD
jgi:LPS sulfotransferase NodH